MKPLTYRITTLGCRVNHAEAGEIESVLANRGLRRAGPHRADLEVVHTCSVTHTAAAKSRHAIRQAARRRWDPPDGSRFSNWRSHQATPDSTGWSPTVIVTGCFVTTNPDDAAGLAGNPDLAIRHAVGDGSTLIERFAGQVDQWLKGQPAPCSIRTPRPGSSTPRGATRAPASEGSRKRSEGVIPGPRVLTLPVVGPRVGVAGRIRAELKIQDGCDAHCTFCIIPRIRSTLRSKTVPDAVDEARQLVDRGHREIVLTGIFLGAYGHETALRRRQAHRHASPLADLLDAVARVPGLERLRLSSLEPGDVTATLLDAMVANAPVVVPHLHLPLQSGSDAVLKMMNRQYRIGDYLEMIDLVNQALTTPDGLPPAITTDVICGFPAETEADFEQTVEVARRVGFLHMHVFPFSPRQGTAAARWTDRHIAAGVTKARVRRLIDLETHPDTGLSVLYRRRLLDRSVRVILEQPDKADPTRMQGRCDHYPMVSIPTDRPRGTLVRAVVSQVTPTRTLGRLAPDRIGLPVLC